MSDFEIYTIHASRFGANTYLLADEQTRQGLVIDPGSWTEDILAAAKEAQVEITMIVNTHGHWDHVDGNVALQAATLAPILIHELDAPMLTNPGLNMAAALSGRGGQGGKAERLLREGDLLTLGQSKISVLHTPGHTPGGLCLVAGDCLICGDTLFKLSCGRTDLPGGDQDALDRSLTRLAALPGDYRVLPGHGPESLLSLERQHNPYLPR